MSTPSIATVITDAGFSLLRAAPGHKLIYTRAVCGSGHVEKTQLAALTEVMDYVMDLSIVEFGPTESAATLRLQLDNSKAPKEFQLYQIGIYAKLLDGEQELIGETLIQIMQYEEPDIVRAVPHVSEFVVNVLLGQAETVEGIIDMAAYVSIRQFSSRTVNGKPLSADVILTSEDIKVSDSDPTTVKTALSNKADCVAPPEYKVATADSWDTGSAAVYQRTQENMVCVCGEFRAIQNKSVEDGTLLGTIPEGFRPRRYIVVPGSVQDGSDRLSCAVQFTASGNIIYNGKPNMSMSMFRIFINCIFFTN